MSIVTSAGPDLSTSLAGVPLRTPILVASGTFGYGEEFGARYDLGRLGGLIVKSITLAPREGNPPPRIAETPSGMLNSIGLQNVGVDAFVRDKLPALRRLSCPVIANVAGTGLEEYEEVCRRLAAAGGLAAVELNVSCPNVKRGMEFGADPALAEEVTRRAKAAWGGPLLVKLSPNVTDLAAIARAVEAGGADGISVANTFLGMMVDIEARRPKLSTGFGGLSGPAIRPLAVRCVWQVAGAVRLPILGMGGIARGEDAVEFLMAGASAVAVGPANFIDPEAPLTVTRELEAWMRDHGVAAVRELVRAARDD